MILHLSSLVRCNIAAIFGIVITVSACTQTVTIPAQYDAALCSIFANDNISGHNIHGSLGLGGYHIISDEVFTFPAAYIGSNRGSDGKDAAALGGFDLSLIPPNFKHARLKFYINYADADRRDIMLFVRPILIPWDDDTCTFKTFYRYDAVTDNYVIKKNAVGDDMHSILAMFDIRANISDEESIVIPFRNSYRTVSINITDILRNALQEPDKFYGLLLDPMSSLDYRYRTKNSHNEISDFGVIQIATSEWLTFNEPDKDGVRYMKNRGLGKMRYVPRIEVE